MERSPTPPPGRAPSPSSSSSHRYPDWVMLDPHTRLNHPTVSLDYPEELFRATSARAETDAGGHIDVRFRAVPPPGASRLYVNWDHPNGGDPSSSGSGEEEEDSNWDESSGFGEEEPLVVAAHRNSILLKLTRKFTSSDYFLYTVDPTATAPPSLRRLPSCALKFYAYKHMFSPEDVGILYDDRREELVVADLKVSPKDDMTAFSFLNYDTPVEAALCLYQSRSRRGDDWKATRPEIRHEEGQGKDLAWWCTDAVVPYGDSLCYVDYFRGILFADVLSGCPQLRYVRLPVKVLVGNPEHCESGLRGCPALSRSVCVTDGGRAVKFVDVVTTAVLFPGDGCRVASSSFAINVWRLRWEDEHKAWEKECAMEDTELWSLRGYGDLPRDTPLFPLVSMQEPNVVYFVLSSIRDLRGVDNDNTWVVVVDMLNKALLSSSGYTKVFGDSTESDGNMSAMNLPDQTAFMPCDFPKYLLATRKRKGDDG